jgi:hypothetical protein
VTYTRQKMDLERLIYGQRHLEENMKKTCHCFEDPLKRLSGEMDRATLKVDVLLHVAIARGPSATNHEIGFKGTVQRDRFGWKWYQSIDLSLFVRRRDFQLILTAHSRVRRPLSFRATSYKYLQLSRLFPIKVQTSCSALFQTPFCYSQLR